MKPFPISLLGVLVLAEALFASVFSKDGNVMLESEKGSVTQLTSSGHDLGPRLSPDGTTVAFVRSFRTPEDDGHGFTNCAVWVVDVTGENARCLVSGGGGKAKDMICDIHRLRFSPDGKDLYFHTAPWASESAIQVVALATGAHQYVMSGYIRRVVPKGQYAGHLLVQRHKYFIGGGSYDWVWLMTPEGEEIGPVSQGEGAYGGSIEDFYELYVK